MNETSYGFVSPLDILGYSQCSYPSYFHILPVVTIDNATPFQTRFKRRTKKVANIFTVPIVTRRKGKTWLPKRLYIFSVRQAKKMEEQTRTAPHISICLFLLLRPLESPWRSTRQTLDDKKKSSYYFYFSVFFISGALCGEIQLVQVNVCLCVCACYIYSNIPMRNMLPPVKKDRIIAQLPQVTHTHLQPI